MGTGGGGFSTGFFSFTGGWGISFSGSGGMAFEGAVGISGSGLDGSVLAGMIGRSFEFRVESRLRGSRVVLYRFDKYVDACLEAVDATVVAEDA